MYLEIDEYKQLEDCLLMRVGNTPKVMFLCRGSVKEGLGHVIRSRTVAKFMQSETNSLLVCIGDQFVENLLLNRDINYEIVATEQEAMEIYQEYCPDFVVFDLLNLDKDNFKKIAKNGMTGSISPVFNCLSEVDLLFHRTHYWDDSWGKDSFKANIRSGLKYAVVSENCHRIPSNLFRKNLESKFLSIAVSMGGTDAANKTLRVLEIIKTLPEKLVIWVMLGEGYTHSFQDLVDCMRGSTHEIILAKSNDSMWKILNTCSLAILSGGITTYEAVFVGLPSINLIENEHSKFLIQELIDNGVVLSAGKNFEEGLTTSLQLLHELYSDRDKLLMMHTKTRGLIDDHVARRIVEDILRATRHR